MDDDDATTTDGDTDDDDDDDVTEDGDADGDIDPTDGDDPDGDLEGECTPATAAVDCQGGQGCINGVCAPCQNGGALSGKPGLRGRCLRRVRQRHGLPRRGRLPQRPVRLLSFTRRIAATARAAGRVFAVPAWKLMTARGLLCEESGLCVPCAGDETSQAQYG